MERKLLTFIIIAILKNFTNAQNLMVQNLLNDVRLDSLTNFVKQLSGEKPVTINGVIDTIKSRHSQNPGNEKAFQFMKQELTRFGYQIDSMNFSAAGKNLFAVKTGYKYPDKRFVLGAHYDNLPATPIAPGADDNASGSAAVLEAARAFSQYNFPFTVMFALWDEEESGLLGSYAYIPTIGSDNETMLGYINLDMLGWDGNNDSVADVHVRPVANSMALAARAESCNLLYNIQLSLHIVNPGTGSTDHAPFWYNNYTAIGFDEEYDTDFNPYWHTQGDSLGQFNSSFFQKCAKLAYATLCELATDTLNMVGINEFDSGSLMQIYPNPFRSGLIIESGESSKNIQRIMVMDCLGRSVLEKKINSRSTSLDLESLPSGVYYLCMVTETHIIQRKIVKS